jgi:fatty-acyl-CoA synthase
VRDRIALALRMLPALPRLLKYRSDARLTAADCFEEHARRHPDRCFCLFEGRRISYGEINASANRVAHWAYGRGLGRGDVVALLMENRPEYVAAWAGLAKLGVTTALLNTHLAGRALLHAIRTADARAVIAGGELAERATPLLGELRGVPVWLARDPAAEASEAPPAGLRDLDRELAEQSDADPDPAEREEVRSGDPLFYIYTSGTTGLPKAARMSHMRFLYSGEAAAFALELGPRDVHYCALPLYHSAGGAMLLSSVLSAGATMALRRRFSASAFWDEVRESEATCFQYIGEFCRYLLNQPPRPDDRHHRVRAIIGNGLRADIWEAFQERFGIPRIVEFYGATEANTAIANLENKVGSVGRFPFKWLGNIRIIRYDVERDETARGPDGLCIECRPDEVGELVAQIPERSIGPIGRFEGYTSKEATDRKVLRDVLKQGDAWFRSGDLMRQDPEGFFYFVDRIGDTFRWKGENVSTQQVAEVLTGFAPIAMANVYGVRVPGADGRAGMAALHLEPGAELDGGALYAFCAEHLPRYATPLFLRVSAAADLTGTLKLRKVKLQEEGYDPERIADPLYFRDDEAGAFVPLTKELHAELQSGARRL